MVFSDGMCWLIGDGGSGLEMTLTGVWRSFAESSGRGQRKLTEVIKGNSSIFTKQRYALVQKHSKIVIHTCE